MRSTRLGVAALLILCLALNALGASTAPGPWSGSIGEALSRDGLSQLTGDAGNNPALGGVLAWHGIALDPTGITLGGRHIGVHDPFLIAALPSPAQPGRPVVVYTASSREQQPALAGVACGPTAVVIGSLVDGELKTIYAGSWTMDQGGHVTGLVLGPTTLSGAEAAEDLRILAGQLDQGYAGLQDLDAAYRARGGSWEVAVDELAGQLSARQRWTWSEVGDRIAALLAPNEDMHFALRGAALSESGELLARDQHLGRHWDAWFAADHLVRRGETWVLGDRVVAHPPSPVPGPHEARLGELYRYPTLEADGSPGWLVGLFALHEDQPDPAFLDGHTLRLHRASVAPAPGGAPYGVLSADVPVVYVRTMAPDQVAGLEQTAPSLKGASRLILDLRQNGGGSDGPAKRWFTALGVGPLTLAPGGNLKAGAAPYASRMSTWGPHDAGAIALPDGFRGALRVLIDEGVASSGETFVELSTQVPGARLYGLNTRGCTRFSNLSRHNPLPHSGLVATFGHSRFDWDAIHPIAETRGIFPDLWLDGGDPVALLAGLR